MADSDKDRARELSADILSAISRHFPEFDLANPGQLGLGKSLTILAILASTEGTICALAGFDYWPPETQSVYHENSRKAFAVGVDLANALLRQAAERAANAVKPN